MKIRDNNNDASTVFYRLATLRREPVDLGFKHTIAKRSSAGTTLHPIHKHGGARSLHQHEENLWYLTALTRVPVCFARPMKPCFSGHLLDVTVVSCSCSRVNYWLPDIPCLVAVATWISRPIDCLSLLRCFQWLRVRLRSGKRRSTRCEVGISHACGLKLAPNRRIVCSAGHPLPSGPPDANPGSPIGLHPRLKKPTIPICSLPHLVRTRLQSRLGRCYNDSKFRSSAHTAFTQYLQSLTLTTPRAPRSAHSGVVLSL
jgi:hypothetical protein